MKGYIYISGTGTDSEYGNYLNDPVFGDPPALGACMPNIRRFVEINDHIFVISGRVALVSQYIVGGFQVAEKISALTAFKRYPQNQLTTDPDGQLHGNIIIDEDGNQHPLDRHKEFRHRIQNYIVGKDPVALTTPNETRIGRDETLPKLHELFGKPGNRVIDIMGRWRKLDAGQISELRSWLNDIKHRANP